MGITSLYRYPNDSSLRREMAKHKYTGHDERTFPSIAVTVKPGDTFEAPADFVAHNVTPVKTTKPTVGDEE
jgi:plastocyanin